MKRWLTVFGPLVALLALLLVQLRSAQAATPPAASLLIDQEPPAARITAVEYEIDVLHSRVIVAIHLAAPTAPGTPETIKRVRVPSLWLDTSAEQIVFNGTRGQAICADFHLQPGNHVSAVLPTGVCSFRVDAGQIYFEVDN